MKDTELLAIVNSSATLGEASARSGLQYNSLLNRLRRMRKATPNVYIKRFAGPRRRQGVMGWLKEHYPQVYEDLRVNYPETYAGIMGKVI